MTPGDEDVADGDDLSDDGTGQSVGGPTCDEQTRCAEPGCELPAAVLLHVPWAENRTVCPGHARVIARQEGIVAEPIEGAEAEWP